MLPSILIVLITLIVIVGLLLNIYVIVAVISTRQPTTANNILLLHLGIINLLISLLYLFISVPNYGHINWSTIGVPCVIHGFLHTFLHPLTLWTICGLNCDRYYAIAAPLHYNHLVNMKKVLIGLAIGWFISILLCIPTVVHVTPYIYRDGYGGCVPNFHNMLWYSTSYAAFTFLLPTTLIICCNLKVLMIARYHRHRIASAIYEVTLSAQVTITHQRNPFFVASVTSPAAGGPPKTRHRNAICTVVRLVAALLLLYIPHYMRVIWPHGTPSILDAIAATLLAIAPTINAFLYGVRSKPLRRTFRNYWRKKQTQNEIQQEIQARTPSTCGSRRPSLALVARPPQRRLSDAALTTTDKSDKTRGALDWRPASANDLVTNDPIAAPTHTVTITRSCNTLRVPDGETSTPPPTNSLMQRIFGNGGRRSPTITITKDGGGECTEDNLLLAWRCRKNYDNVDDIRRQNEMRSNEVIL